MYQRIHRPIWIITGLVALILLATTIYLSREARAKKEAGFTGYVAGLESVVYLRQEPERVSRIVTILELGQPVYVTDKMEVQENTWYFVNAGDFEGWIPSERVGMEPP